jgi:hypothetical protein
MSLRSFSFGAISLLVFFGSSAFTIAFAQGATVSQGGGARTTDCNGGDAVLNGSGNSVNFRSSCRTLTLNGSGNAIKIELQPGGTITLNGTVTMSATHRPAARRTLLSPIMARATP